MKKYDRPHKPVLGFLPQTICSFQHASAHQPNKPNEPHELNKPTELNKLTEPNKPN